MQYTAYYTVYSIQYAVCSIQYAVYRTVYGNKDANMMNINVRRCVYCKIKYTDRTIHETLYVLENQICGLLSRRDSVALGVVRLIGEIT